MIFGVHEIFVKMNFIALLLAMLPMYSALKPCSKDGKPCISRNFNNISFGKYLSYLFGDSVRALAPSLFKLRCRSSKIVAIGC